MQRLRVALLGVEGVGVFFLDALCRSEQYDVVAAGDEDLRKLQRLSLPDEIKLYEDCRSLVVEFGHAALDILVIALPTFKSREYVKLAAKFGLHVLHLSPVGRTAEELLELDALIRNDSATLTASQYWIYDRRYSRLSRGRAKLGRIDSAAMLIETTIGSAGWRGHSIRAGGGALLQGAYAELHTMISLLGFPQSVYTECTSAGKNTASRNYDTEDVANVIVGFPDSATASLLVRRSLTSDRRLISLYGENDTLSIQIGPGWSRRWGTGSRESGNLWQQAIDLEIAAFATALADQSLAQTFPTKRHLQTLAVIDAAYLSVRTGQAEIPAKFLPDH